MRQLCETRPLAAIWAALCGCVIAGSSTAWAQAPNGRPVYYPLSQTSPTMMAGEWAAKIGKGAGTYFQPIRVDLPGAGTVTWYDGGPTNAVSLPAPAQASCLVGPFYRLKISDMPEFPGVELYPSIEVLDRLHPPPGRTTEFPVPIEFTEAEIQMAVDGRMVTKVVYLEQPNRASAAATGRNNSLPTKILAPRDNPIYAADLAGRPMVIVRLGGRVPSDNEPPAFYGVGAPIKVDEPAPPQPSER